jgi:hypothetical protein
MQAEAEPPFRVHRGCLTRERSAMVDQPFQKISFKSSPFKRASHCTGHRRNRPRPSPARWHMPGSGIRSRYLQDHAEVLKEDLRPLPLRQRPQRATVRGGVIASSWSCSTDRPSASSRPSRSDGPGWDPGHAQGETACGSKCSDVLQAPPGVFQWPVDAAVPDRPHRVCEKDAAGARANRPSAS